MSIDAIRGFDEVNLEELYHQADSKAEVESRSNSSVEEENSHAYTIEIQQLVAEAFAMLATVSRRDSERMDELKRRYQFDVQSSADTQRSLGDFSPSMAIVAIAIFGGGSFFSQMQKDPTLQKHIFEGCSLAANQTQNMASPYTGRKNASMRTLDGEANLEINEYQAKAGAKNQENSKEIYRNLMETLNRSKQEASRGN